MEKTIEIDGRPVTFRATAAIPRLYRLRFHRDIMQDMAFMRKEILKAQKEKKSVPVDILTLFENVAFLMAKHADPAWRQILWRDGWRPSAPSASTRYSL